jgi:hypothetical protein
VVGFGDGFDVVRMLVELALEGGGLGGELGLEIASVECERLDFRARRSEGSFLSVVSLFEGTEVVLKTVRLDMMLLFKMRTRCEESKQSID